MEQEGKKEKRISGRSSGYPGFALDECVEGVQKVKQELGNGSSSRDLIAKAMGYSGLTGASGTKISACVHFGLLDRTGNAYALSELSRRVLTPLSDDERREAVVEAMRAPVLYNKLIEAYAGRALPGMLENILVRDYKIIDNSAKRAAEIFKKSLEYAGMLRNGIVQVPGEVRVEAGEAGRKDGGYEGEQMVNNGALSGMGRCKDEGCFVVELPNTGVRLVVPREFSYEISTGELAAEIKALKEKFQEVALKYEENTSEVATDSKEG